MPGNLIRKAANLPPVQEAQVNPEPAAALSYAHESGEVSTVESTERALELCKFLAEMAITQPQKAKDMAELATMQIPGVNHQPKPAAKEVDPVEPEKTRRTTAIEKPEKPIPILRTIPEILESPKQLIEIPEPVIKTEKQPEDSKHHEKVTAQFTVEQIRQKIIHEQARRSTEREDTEATVVQETPSVSQNTHEEIKSPVVARNSEDPVVKEPTATSEFSHMPDILITEEAKPTEVQEAAVVTEFEAQTEVDQPVELVEETNLIAEVEIPELDQSIETHELELEETFGILLGLIEENDTTMDNEYESIPEASSLHISPQSSKAETTLNEEISENMFEVFISEQPEIEPVDTFEEIQEVANEQPAETTLVQIAQAIEADVLVPKEIFDSIDKLVELFEVTNEDSRETKVQLTPEITSELLNLFSAMGYSNPSEALINLVTEKDFEFIIQAVVHLSTLSAIDESREFIKQIASSGFIADISKALSAKLGQATLSFC